MQRAYLFPGQGFQYVGMGKNLYKESAVVRDYFERANELLGYRITDFMFNGPAEKLDDTQIVQNAIYLLSLLTAWHKGDAFQPQMVAGHSLGETPALVAAGVLSFEDGLMLMNERAVEMEKAFRATPAKMTAVIGLEDEVVEKICEGLAEIVVAANYNCPGQIVISGTVHGVERAKIKLAKAGARRLVDLQVHGAVHSPLMQPVVYYLKKKLETISFNEPRCPIYPNVTGVATVNIKEIKQCLMLQQIMPLRWTTTIQNMMFDGATTFVDCGPAHVISGMARKISREVMIDAGMV